MFLHTDDAQIVLVCMSYQFVKIFVMGACSYIKTRNHGYFSVWDEL